MSIVGSLPDNLQNGTTADASQVMADLNFIANQVNANAMPVEPDGFTSTGTITVVSTPTTPAMLKVDGSGDGTNGAQVVLLGNGATTPSKTLRVIGGIFNIVNDAFTQQLMTLDDSGNLWAFGDITSASDERMKTDWQPLAPDFLKRLAALKRGTFTNTETGKRQVGVGAQSLQAFMPEAVRGDERLAVAYGQAALVACAELAEEVMRLRALLEAK
jgi:hypothetical protein